MKTQPKKRLRFCHMCKNNAFILMQNLQISKFLLTNPKKNNNIKLRR